MTALAAFQKCTVDVALSQLWGQGPRRFLVADEVGLGKTIVARAVAEGLRQRRHRLNVMYLCPSLEIAGQNRPKFVSLTGIDEKTYVVGEDRLTLVPRSPPQEGNGYRIFTFTPETSLPGWKPGPRTGRKAERALIRRLLDRYDRLRPVVLRMDQDRTSNRRQLLGDSAPDLEGYSFAGIERALRAVFDQPTGNLETAIIAWLAHEDVDLAEFIARFRAALVLAALRTRTVRPDLIILDEFHRYADLILPKAEPTNDVRKLERARVHQLLIDALLNGEEPPAVLLMSATPYRLRRLNGEEIHPVEHYRALVDLAGFLANDPAFRDQVETAMRDYHEALSTPGTPDSLKQAVFAAKRHLEALLAPIMARTERALVETSDLFERHTPKVEIDAADLSLFRHFAESCDGHMAGWLPAIWSSIPYPAQTMQGYALWPRLRDGPPPPIHAGSGRGKLAHPQLRALSEMIGASSGLSLPWQPPTAPWWRLEAPWSSKAAPGKTLLFSKWKGAPTSISALLSIQLARGIRPAGSKAPAPLLRPGGSESGALIGMFMPWPHLSHAIQPLKRADRTLATVRRDAERQLEAFLDGHKVSVSGEGRRPGWIVACALERRISKSAFARVASAAAAARGKSKSIDWRSIEAISSVSRYELAALANHLLSAPGPIIARCARRHGIPQDQKWQMDRVFGFAWNHLRGYLGHRVFKDAILAVSKKSRYPEALCDAMLKGGFESVLDEQMSLLSRLGDATGFEIIDELTGCLLGRPSLVQFRGGTGGKHRIPVQAATPFAGGEPRKTRKSKNTKLRGDLLRRAFNSPFWPHLLCTTSVGQEGLDFHLWCRRIVHWDLPSDPVDFEQREGRIARYGSLAVRQSLAKADAEEALARAAGASPFNALLDAAGRRPAGRTGLERWWLPENGKPLSVSFDWPFSLRSLRKEALLKDLLYYRLALGQPDPEAFKAMLKRVNADADDARSLAINLSAISRPVL